MDFFDQSRFYPVIAEELFKDREDFLRGRFKIKIEETSFNLGKYEQFLKEHEDTIRAFKDHQEASFEAERKMWKEKGLDEFDSETQDAPAIVEETVPDGCEAARTNIPRSVWKVLVEDGQKVREGDTLVILESMKMEFPVTAEYSGIIEKVYLKPGEQVNSGQLAASIRV